MKYREAIGLLLVLCVAGCSFTKDKETGQRVAEQSFTDASAPDTPQLWALYDDAFYKATPREKWMEMYGAIQSKLGKPLRHTLSTWNVASFAGTGESGSYVKLVYDVEYEKARGTETIDVFIPRGSDTGHIRGHHFNSDALLK